ncbi:DEAD/DEAH box helicase [Helicosporidium sp. ATCC 50920]|nr:DEAD/DEAH box helicase [Helicosporidium sp. ATCC 50920]|eukprot:KDD75819.1 DEAD/DEAH box helicase [Helicosporidium sp. ATCC 50920]
MAIPVPTMAPSDEAERKRLKKLAKREAKALAAAAEEGETKGKKEKKRKKEAAAAAEPKPPAADAEKRSKKERKGDKSARPAELARVGDRTRLASLPALVKSLYSPSPEVAARSSAEAASWRAERSVVLEDSAEVTPLLAFPESGLSADLLHAVKNFSRPSPIQAQCLPLALDGRDLVGIAATGSGKTLAFGLPGLAHVLAQRGQERDKQGKNPPRVLVLAPTRELVQQIEAVLSDAGSRCGVACLAVYGGVERRAQIQALQRGQADVVVATPGRLADLVEQGSLKLERVSYVVLDEADRMLDLGFEPQIRQIVGQTRADRQTLMFSATWPNAIRTLAADFLSSPAKVTVGSADLAASHSVAQVVRVLEAHERDQALLKLLDQHAKSSGAKEGAKASSNGKIISRTIVFVLYKKEAERVEAFLKRSGWGAQAVHGDVSQSQRTAAVEAFKKGSCSLLVATDVAARGLDIPDVQLVINYSFPLTTEDYVHRIGRTGRAGKTGLAHTFFVGANDKARAGELINVLREAEQPVPEDLLRFGTTVKKKESKLYGAHFKDVDMTQKGSKISFDSDDE